MTEGASKMLSSVRARQNSAIPAICAFLCLVVGGGCAHQPAPSGHDLPGFWSGLLHGFLIFFSLAGSLFVDVRIYAYPNAGGWYDLGYFLGAALFLGGGGASTGTSGGGTRESAEDDDLDVDSDDSADVNDLDDDLDDTDDDWDNEDDGEPPPPKRKTHMDGTDSSRCLS